MARAALARALIPLRDAGSALPRTASEALRPGTIAAYQGGGGGRCDLQCYV